MFDTENIKELKEILRKARIAKGKRLGKKEMAEILKCLESLKNLNNEIIDNIMKGIK